MPNNTLLVPARDILMSVAEKVAGFMQLEPQNIYAVFLIIIFLFISSKIIGWIPKLKDSWVAWFIGAIVLYLGGKSLGL